MNKEIMWRYIPAMVFMVLGFIYGRYSSDSWIYLAVILGIGLIAILIAKPEEKQLEK
jgi:hypothetical protein